MCRAVDGNDCNAKCSVIKALLLALTSEEGGSQQNPRAPKQQTKNFATTDKALTEIPLKRTPLDQYVAKK